MRVASYLLQRQDTYYFRQVCNQFLKSKLGKREIVKSLGVKEKSIAIRMAREFKIRLDHLVDQLHSDESITASRATLHINKYINSIKNSYLHEEKGKLHRDTNVAEITSPPPLSSNCKNESHSSIEIPPTFLCKEKLVTQLFDKFAKEKIQLKQWSVKTLKERSAHIVLILELLMYIKGTRAIHIDDITKKDVRNLKELLLLLPKNHNKKFSNLSTGKLIEICKSVDNGNVSGITTKSLENLQDKISLNTLVDKYVSTVKAFWKWLIQYDYIQDNVFEILQFNYRKITNSWKSYTAQDLNVLFNDRIFNDHSYLYPYQYFVPIISLYTACRLQEICQLRVSDVEISNDLSIIQITNADNTSIKTASSERIIPLHQDLIDSGFLRYVKDQKMKQETFVFPELKSSEDSTSIKRVSKWFNERYRTKKGFGKGYSFHSLRRTFINEMSRNGANDSDIRVIIGHKPLKSDTLNQHYKDQMSVHEKFELITNYIRYDFCNFPWLNRQG